MFDRFCKALWAPALVALLAACGGNSQNSGSGASSSGAAGSSSSSSSASSASSSSGDPAWTFCANEGDPCRFSGLRLVRFGVSGQWSEAIYNDEVRCDAALFRMPSDGGRRCELSTVLIAEAPTNTGSSSSSSSSSGAPGQPPHQGTVFLDPDIIRPGDPSGYMDMTHMGQAQRRAWHSEHSATISFNAYIYVLRFSDSPSVEISVEDSVGSESVARAEAERLAIPLGQIPALLRQSVKVVTVFAGLGRGTASAGGLISTYAEDNVGKIRDGYLEEFLVHEATHTSLDAKYYADPDYQRARAADNNFVSTYARDNANSEDISESIVPYIAVRYRADRITADMENRIRAAMGHRIAFFDAQNLDFAPVHNTSAAVRSRLVEPAPDSTLTAQDMTFQWTSTANASLYDLILGTTGPGSSDIRAAQATVDTFLNVDNLPEQGGRVYARLSTQVQGRWRYEDYTYFGFHRFKTAAEMQQPLDGTHLRATDITVVWDKPVGATHFDLHLGDQGVGSSNLRASQIVTESTLKLTNLPAHGKTLYLRLFTKNETWQYRDYTLLAANNSSQAVLLAPAPGGPRPAGTSVEFVWDAPLAARSYDLLIGTSGAGSTDIRASNVINTNRLLINNLPADGRRIYVRLWTLTNDWAYTDYEF